jgi:electron transfer flavoprotein alpha subunit
MGNAVGAVAEALRGYGAARVRLAQDPALAGLLADRAAHVVVEAARAEEAAWIVAASSTFSKDLLPRVAALLDAGMLTDVIGVEGDSPDSFLFRRPMYAGNAIGAVRLAGPARVLTVRATAYSPAAPAGEAPSPVEPLPVDAAALPDGSEYVGLEGAAPSGSRPDLTEARVVVTGGRPMKDGETFERLAGALADLLGGAAGGTRAAVDSGIVPNDLQVGQTGKIVAPDLYIALGVSGAIQHLAGMKDSKVVVAINKDPDAPIFDIADYGLVADIHEAVPTLIEWLRKMRG